jgi:hypothetical protein
LLLRITIVGSGFCVHPEGIVITCEHVFRNFVDPQSYERMKHLAGEANPQPFEFKGIRPT